MIYMFLSNNPLSGDINSSNLSYFPTFRKFTVGGFVNQLIKKSGLGWSQAYYAIGTKIS